MFVRPPAAVRVSVSVNPLRPPVVPGPSLGRGLIIGLIAARYWVLGEYGERQRAMHRQRRPIEVQYFIIDFAFKLYLTSF